MTEQELHFVKWIMQDVGMLPDEAVEEFVREYDEKSTHQSEAEGRD